MRAIDGFSVILLETLKPSIDPQSGRYIEKIRENTHAMSRLIEDLLNFSRMSRQSLLRMPVQPEKIAMEAYQELRQERQGRNIEFIIGPLPEGQADPVLLKLVFSNLLANAIKFTRIRDHARIEIGYLRHTDEVVYFIRDNVSDSKCNMQIRYSGSSRDFIPVQNSKERVSGLQSSSG